jgi:DMSO reductase family type II enzyme chaperone
VLHQFYSGALPACLLDAVRESLGAKVEAATEPAELQGTFNSLFGHAVRGRCPPYELEYGGSEIIQQASGLADIAGFYSAFGMEISPDADDRPDHVAIESEFMSVLCAKEAHAIENSEADHLDIGVKAQRDFLKDHLACWLPAYAHRVEQADPDGFYGALARFASAFVAAECDRFEITVGPKTLKLRPTDRVLDTSIDCGPADGGSGRAEDELVQLNLPSDNDGD